MPRPIDADPPSLGFLVDRRQALRAGLTDDQIRHRVRGGHWRALHSGVYLRVAAGPQGFEGHDAEQIDHTLRAAAATRAHPHATLAFGTAAVLHSLPLVTGTPSLCQLAVPTGAWTGIRDRVRYRQLDLPDEDVIDVGARRTTVARTWADVARTQPLADALAVGDRALRAGTMTREEAAVILERAGRVRGRRLAQAALPLVDGARETPLESFSAARFHEWALPQPVCQQEFRDDEGFVGRVDFWWPDARVVGEADGRGKYVDRDDLYAEKLREDRLRALGLTVIRWSWGDLWRGDALRRRLRTALLR